MILSTLTITAAEGLADELGAIEGELVPFMIPGTAIKGSSTMGGSSRKSSSLVGKGVFGLGVGFIGVSGSSKVRPRFLLTVPGPRRRRILSVAE